MSGARIGFELTLYDDEPLGSVIDRLSAIQLAPRATVLTQTGLASGNAPCFLWGYGFGLTPSQLDSLSRALELPTERVQAMLLPALGNNALAISPSAKAQRRWIYSSGSHACPSCLAERHGAWKLAWKLPFSFACVRHRCLLLHTCPGCGQRLGHPTRMHNSDAIAEPGHCTRKTRGHAKGEHGRPCRYDLTTATTIPLKGRSSALDAQHVIDHVLAGHPLTLGDKLLQPNQVLDDLQLLSTLLLHVADGDDLAIQTDWARDAFHSYRSQHPLPDQPLYRRHPASSGGRFSLSKQRPTIDTRLNAATFTTALSILAADTVDLAAEHLAHLGPRLTAADNPIGTPLYKRPLSPRLKQIIAKTLQHTHTTTPMTTPIPNRAA